MKNLITIFFLFLVGNVFGQGFKFAGIQYTNFLQSNIIDAPHDQSISFQEFRAFLNYPIKFKNEKTTLILGIQYDMNQSTIHNIPLFSATNHGKRLHMVAYNFTLVHKLNDKWILIGKIKPTMASDFAEKLSKNDFLFQGSGLVAYKVNDDLTLGTGIIYTTQTGKPRFWPALMFKYTKNKHLVDILLPSRFRYLYQIGKKETFRIGIQGGFDGGDYNISIKDFVDADPSSINNVVYTRINLGLLLNFKLTETIKLDLTGGISGGRRYEFENFDEIFYKYNLENGPFLSAGLVFIPQK